LKQIQRKVVPIRASSEPAKSMSADRLIGMADNARLSDRTRLCALVALGEKLGIRPKPSLSPCNVLTVVLNNASLPYHVRVMAAMSLLNS
jgi:hypothetical protein